MAKAGGGSMKLKAYVHAVETYSGTTVITLHVEHAYENADGVSVEQAPYELARHTGKIIEVNLGVPEVVARVVV